MGHNSPGKGDPTRRRAGRPPSRLKPSLPYRIEEIATIGRKRLINPTEGPPWKYAPLRGRPLPGVLGLIIGEDRKRPPKGRVYNEGLAYDVKDAQARMHGFVRRFLLRAGGESRRRRAAIASGRRGPPVS
jgi:hypothetical protein